MNQQHKRFKLRTRKNYFCVLICTEVRDLEIEEMSLEEKYDKLYDQYIITDGIAMAFIKEMGLQMSIWTTR